MRSGGEALGEEDDAEDDHGCPGDPRDSARGCRPGAEKSSGGSADGKVDNAAGEGEREAEDHELGLHRPWCVGMRELRQERDEDQQALRGSGR